MPSAADRKTRFPKVWIAPLVVLVISLAATFAAWRYTRHSVDQRAETRFDNEVRRTRTLIRERLNLYISALYSAQALFAASQSVERDEWSIYILKENVRGRYPGLAAMRFVERVPDAALDAFAASVRSDATTSPDGYPDFKVHPRAATPEHYVVKFVHPERGNEQMLGADLSAESTLRETLEKGRDTGQPVATGRIPLTGDGAFHDGFVVFLPIYANGAPVDTVEERRAAHAGFVDAAFRMDDLLSAIFGEMIRNSNIDFEVYEGTVVSKENLLYDNFNELQLIDADRAPRFTATIPMEVADKTWTLRFTSLPEFGRDPAEQSLPRLTLAFGLVLSVLLAGIVFSVTTAYFAAVRLAEGMTAKLRESQERLRLIIETAHDAFVSTDGEGRITGWNAQAETTFGWTAAEVLGKPLAPTLLPPRHHATFESGLKLFLSTGEAPLLNKRIELCAQRRDGRELPVEAKIWSVRTEGGYRFNAFVHDISARRRNQRRVAIQVGVTTVLAESDTVQDAMPNVLRTIGENLDWDAGLLWRVDPESRTLRCTESWYAPEMDLSGFVTISRQRVFASGSGLPGRVWASGEPAWIPDVVRDPNFPRAPIAAKAGLHGAFAFPITLGEEFLGVMEFYARETRVPDDDVLSMMLTAGRQIGQFLKRKEAEEELRRKTADLARSNRELEQFAYIASHDLQEPLRKVAGYAQLLKDELAGRLDPESVQHLTQVVEGAERMRALIHDLLAYSHASRAELTFEPTNVAAVMNETLSRLEQAIRDQGAFVTYDPLPTVMANATQMSQLMQNLIDNAVKYRSERPPRVHVSAKQQDGEWLFSVTDNGIGIDLQYADRIFIMFQRLHTREEYPGTGIGLAICKKIVERHGGRIWVDSRPGQGTTFFFTLPVR